MSIYFVLGPGNIIVVLGLKCLSQILLAKCLPFHVSPFCMFSHKREDRTLKEKHLLFSDGAEQVHGKSVAVELESQTLHEGVVVLISGVVFDPEEVISKRHLCEGIVRDPERGVNVVLVILYRQEKATLAHRVFFFFLELSVWVCVGGGGGGGEVM